MPYTLYYNSLLLLLTHPQRLRKASLTQVVRLCPSEEKRLHQNANLNALFLLTTLVTDCYAYVLHDVTPKIT